MADALFAPAAETKTADQAERSVHDAANTMTSRGAAPSITVAPFIVRVSAAADSKDRATAAPKGPQEPDGDTQEEAPFDIEDGEVIGPGTPIAKERTTTPLSSEHKAQIILKALRSVEQSIRNVITLLETDLGDKATATTLDALRDAANALPKTEGVSYADAAEGGRVIEGVFNGRNMVGSDGKIYTVPPNYASKSKLVEGDLLKLTITPSGSFIYKQIGPIDRSRIVASLGFDHTTGEWYATSDNRRWSVIKASVTYFKGDPGDEVVLLVPKSEPSKWAAVENIIKKDPLV